MRINNKAIISCFSSINFFKYSFKLMFCFISLLSSIFSLSIPSYSKAICSDRQIQILILTKTNPFLNFIHENRSSRRVKRNSTNDYFLSVVSAVKMVNAKLIFYAASGNQNIEKFSMKIRVRISEGFLLYDDMSFKNNRIGVALSTTTKLINN